MKQITKITLTWELVQAGMAKVHIAEKLHISRATLYRWVEGIEAAGDVERFLDRYLAAKKGPRQRRTVNGWIKAVIYDIRREHQECCGQKIQYFLQHDYGISLGVTTIYRILREKYILRSKWKKNQKRGPVPQATKPREVVQVDTVDFGGVFAFAGIDICTREADVVLRPALTSADGAHFLNIAMPRRFDGFVQLIQTDAGSEFQAAFKAVVRRYTHRHRIARPYKKTEQASIESFNRSLRKECLGWSRYRAAEIPTLTREVEQYLEYYHTRRPHLSLGMRPPLARALSHIYLK